MNDLTLFEQLALVGLSRPPKKQPGATPSDILDAKLLQHLGATKADLTTALNKLTGRGMAEELPRAPRSRSARWRMLPSGEKAFEAAMGGISLKDATWKQKAVRVVCVQIALSLSPEVAAKFVQHNALTAYYLAKRLGDPFLKDFQPGATAESIARQITAGALEVTNVQPEHLWRGLLRRAASQKGAAVNLATEAQPSAEEPERNDKTMATPIAFAQEVQLAARASRQGWFGSEKIFIHRAWESWKSITGNATSLSTFKASLLDALRTDQIILSRADFTVDLDPADLEASETRYGTETYHFITSQRDHSL